MQTFRIVPSGSIGSSIRAECNAPECPRTTRVQRQRGPARRHRPEPNRCARAARSFPADSPHGTSVRHPGRLRVRPPANAMDGREPLCSMQVSARSPGHEHLSRGLPNGYKGAMAIAHLIREARERAGLTRAELARRAGVAASTVGRIEARSPRPFHRPRGASRAGGRLRDPRRARRARPRHRRAVRADLAAHPRRTARGRHPGGPVRASRASRHGAWKQTKICSLTGVWLRLAETVDRFSTIARRGTG